MLILHFLEYLSALLILIRPCRPFYGLLEYIVGLYEIFSTFSSSTFSPLPSDCSRMQVSKEGNDISDVSEIWEVRSISLRTGDYNRQCMASEIARKVGK